MRHARLAALTAAVVLAITACSSSASTTPSASAPTFAPATPAVASSGAASVAPASVVPSTAPSVAAASGATGDAVAIADFSFQPATLTVPVGTTVKWKNNDSTGHTVTADDGSFKSERLGSGAAFSQTFATAGTFAYHCSIHPGMKGTITVQ